MQNKELQNSENSESINSRVDVIRDSAVIIPPEVPAIITLGSDQPIHHDHIEQLSDSQIREYAQDKMTCQEIVIYQQQDQETGASNLIVSDIDNPERTTTIQLDAITDDEPFVLRLGRGDQDNPLHASQHQKYVSRDHLSVVVEASGRVRLIGPENGSTNGTIVRTGKKATEYIHNFHSIETPTGSKIAQYIEGKNSPEHQAHIRHIQQKMGHDAIELAAQEPAIDQENPSLSFSTPELPSTPTIEKKQPTMSELSEKLLRLNDNRNKTPSTEQANQEIEDNSKIPSEQLDQYIATITKQAEELRSEKEAYENILISVRGEANEMLRIFNEFDHSPATALEYWKTTLEVFERDTQARIDQIEQSFNNTSDIQSHEKQSQHLLVLRERIRTHIAYAHTVLDQLHTAIQSPSNNRQPLIETVHQGREHYRHNLNSIARFTEYAIQENDQAIRNSYTKLTQLTQEKTLRQSSFNHTD